MVLLLYKPLTESDVWPIEQRQFDDLSDLQGHSPTACLFKCLSTAVQHLTRFKVT